MKGISTAVNAYAFDYRRTYPHRSAFTTLVSDARPQTLYSAQVADAVDDRRLLSEYLALKMFIDPFCEPINLDPDLTHPDSFVYSSYSLLFNWQFTGEPGMMRVGDRFGWRRFKFNVLISDTDSMAKGGDGMFAHSSHPDYDGMLASQAFQDQREFGISWTFSFWTRTNAWDRGPVDRQFTYTDGSVQRLDRVKVYRNNNDYDARVVQIPMRKGQNPGSWEHLPDR
jgi:hypothetical protein